MFFLIGVSIFFLPIVFAWLKYGDDDPVKSLEKMIFNSSLQDILKIQLTINFGLFVIMFAWFRFIVFHKL